MGADNNINDEIIDQLVIKVGELEKREYPDYAGITRDLKGAAEALQEQVSAVKSMLATVPENIPVKYQVTLGLKMKEIIAAMIIWLMVTALQTGLIAYLWTSSNRLKASDLKYRAIRQVFPDQARWADSIYHANADWMASTTDSLEEAAKVNSNKQDLDGQKKRELPGRHRKKKHAR